MQTRIRGGGLMPEFITLADGSLAVKGRNLLKQSCPLKPGNWITNGGGCTLDTEITYEGNPTLRTSLGGGIQYYPVPRTSSIQDPTYWLPVIPGQTYTYSMCLKAEGTVKHAPAVPLHWHFVDNEGDNYPQPSNVVASGTIVPGEWSVIHTKFTARNKWMRPFVYTGKSPAVPVNIAWIKLEYGDEMTGPSAAPEDEEVN